MVRSLFRRIPVFAVVSAVIVSCPSLARSQTIINVNVGENRHTINPNIYGIANTTQAQIQDLNTPLVRYGGDSASTYNWLVNGDNRGTDWYFESIGDTSSVQGYRGDSFISMNKAAGSQAMVTIPMLPYVATLGKNRSIDYSFSIKKYGAQTGSDPYLPDSGNGISTKSGNPFITGNKPLDAYVASSATTQLAWIEHIIAKWGKEVNGGLRYYIMDNEPSIWHSVHRDVHPTGESMNEIYNDYLSYAGNVRAKDSGALIVGPEEWGWTGYFYSGLDQQYGASHGWGGPFPDQSAHGGMSYVPWFLQQLYKYQKSSGKQLLNVFSLHYYPQSGEFSNDDSAAMRATRNKSTRSLWDPNYTDVSWINSVVQLIPRMKSWVSVYYPGLQTGITEYNWGDEPNLNGATTQADIFGIFGQQALDMACRWGAPASNTPTYLAMKMYRNYDGQKSTFGDTSVACSVPNPDNLSAFAAQRTIDNAVTVMVINKVGTSAPINIDISGFTPGPDAQPYQISTTTQTGIAVLPQVAVAKGVLTATVPPQSITLYVIPTAPSGAQYDFEGSIQGWTTIGTPTATLNDSTLEHYTGTRSLSVSISGNAGTTSAYVPTPTTPAGATVTFHVWIPTGSPILSIQPYVEQGKLGGYTFTGTYVPIKNLTAGGWNTITVAVPKNAVTPLYSLGVQFTTGSKWTGTCYIDTVEW